MTAARWTTPAADLGPADAAIQAQVPVFIRWGRSAQWQRPDDDTIKPTLTPTWETSSWSWYPAEAATTTRRVWASATGDSYNAAPMDEPARWTNLPATFPFFRIPWHNGSPGAPAWRGAAGTTDQGVLIDYEDGRGWEMQGMRASNWWDRLLIALRQIGKGIQPQAGDYVCDSAELRTPDNAFTYKGRGMGMVPKRVGIVTAAEVAAAREHGHRGIGHLMAGVGFAMRTGPAADFLPPATRVEFPTERNQMQRHHPNAPHPRLTSQGLVLASTLTEDEIDQRLAVRIPDDLEWRATVKVWWMTLSEHGVCIGAETGTGDPVIETTSMAPGYYEQPAWAALGHTSHARNRSVWDDYPWETLYAVRPTSYAPDEEPGTTTTPPPPSGPTRPASVPRSPVQSGVAARSIAPGVPVDMRPPAPPPGTVGAGSLAPPRTGPAAGTLGDGRHPGMAGVDMRPPPLTRG